MLPNMTPQMSAMSADNRTVVAQRLNRRFLTALVGMTKVVCSRIELLRGSPD
jgi:hypothetical protein